MVWRKFWSKSKGKHYYADSLSSVSVWVRPEEYESDGEAEENDGGGPAKRQRQEDGDGKGGDGGSGGSAPQQAKQWNRYKELDDFKPPVAGNAADLVAASSQVLKRPVITAQLPPSNKNMWERTDIQVNKHLEGVYISGTITDRHDKPHKFKDCTNPIQGRHLYNLVRQNGFSRTLEVGFAMGASAVWICQAQKENGIANSAHIAIDPNQTSQYDNIGRLLLERAGLLNYLSVMEMTSYRAMPKLLEDVVANKIPRFHLIYIDGWHTFDYTLVDFFYADLLLAVNGVIVLDDIMHSPVKKCVDYICANWPHYALVPQTPCYDPANPKVKSSQATFVKLAEDSRTWNAHTNF
jgi:predicted O-methyltransferase YrrM